MENHVKEKIESYVKNHDVVLFMKGTAEMPRCGFSSTSSFILSKLGADFKDVDVLEDEEIRSGIKEYADWPTIPQLYIKGEFIGGCDIMKEMYESGELREILAEKGVI